ncbi:MAG: DNA polymerase III subunit gamma/tau [Pseudomonadota bacterium]|nr:DNA polymerase III subunit gamma/tau [Pseudomonadota bacterium]
MMQDENQPPENETSDSAPVIDADAPGFDMLAEADAENNVQSGADYKVLARKYRPRNFDDLIGQESMVRTLTNAFETGRIAHAFMLTGVRGVGKTTTARILARALNYTGDGVDAPSINLAHPGTHCEAIMDGSHVDVIEMDAASRTGIGDIREIIENVRYAPAAARFKVYIIDEVHMLSKAAFNGLLKTLEEPPAHVKFIFATTEIRQVPVTVLSRCQRFDLRRLTPEDTSALLDKVSAAEDIKLNDEVTALIARAADGSARDALSLLDRALAHAGDAGDALNAETVRGLLGLADRGRVFDLFEMLMGGKLPEALAEFQAQYELGADPAVIIADLAELTHWITRLKYVPGADEDVSFSQSARARGRSAAEMLSTRVLSRAWQVLLKGHEETQTAFNTRAAAEMILIRLAHMADTPTPDELVRQYESAKPAPTPPASASPAPASSPPSAPTPAPSASSSSRGSASPVALGAVPEQAAAVSPASAASQPAAQIRLLESFEALLELVSEKRDLGLKHALEHGVHLVHFEAAQADKGGRLEIRLAGEQPNIAQDLTRKLREWTGQNWMVSLSSETGDQTIASRRQTAADIRHEAAMADPLVKAALDVFPDARIEAITELDEPALSPADTDAGGDTDIGGEDA